MMRKAWRYILLIAVIVAALPSLGVQAKGDPGIDLDQDLNRDGVPDALAAEIERIAKSEDQDAAIQDFVNRLPYSAETRELQAEAARLQARLEDVRDSEQAQAIREELQALSDKMMADPNYAKTIEGLNKLLTPVDDSQIESVRWDWLWRGDVMLVRDEDGKLGKFTTFLYAMWYTHAGNYDGNSLVYESNADGVRLKPLSKWQQAGQYIALGYDNKRSASQVQGAMDWAKGRYGTDGSTPYNYFFPNKWTDGSLYCSQLTWKIHDHLGVNLDSNHSTYRSWIAARWGWFFVWTVSDPAVAPDEVGLDGDVSIYSEGWN